MNARASQFTESEGKDGAQLLHVVGLPFFIPVSLMICDCLIFGLMLKVDNKHITRSSGVFWFFFSNWSSLEFYIELSIKCFNTWNLYFWPNRIHRVKSEETNKQKNLNSCLILFKLTFIRFPLIFGWELRQVHDFSKLCSVFFLLSSTSHI